MTFCIRDLSIHGFWCSWGSWNQSPMDTEGWLYTQRLSLERYTGEEKAQWLRHREVGTILLYTYLNFDPYDPITYLKVNHKSIINHHLWNTCVCCAISQFWSLGFKVRLFPMFSVPSLRKTDCGGRAPSCFLLTNTIYERILSDSKISRKKNQGTWCLDSWKEDLCFLDHPFGFPWRGENGDCSLLRQLL